MCIHKYYIPEDEPYEDTMKVRCVRCRQLKKLVTQHGFLIPLDDPWKYSRGSYKDLTVGYGRKQAIGNRR